MLAIVLRICLALGVLLNGAGPAMAAVHAPGSAMAAGGTMEADLPCHEAGGEGLAGSDAALGAPAVGVPEPAGQPAEDCCGGGPCECACVQPGHVPLPATAHVPAVAMTLQRAGQMRSSHASPALPHLIRPPIS